MAPHLLEKVGSLKYFFNIECMQKAGIRVFSGFQQIPEASQRLHSVTSAPDTRSMVKLSLICLTLAIFQKRSRIFLPIPGSPCNNNETRSNVFTSAMDTIAIAAALRLRYTEMPAERSAWVD